MFNKLIPFALACAATAAAQECSNATLKGAFAYAIDALVTVDGKTSTNSDVGRLVFDGNGKFTGKAAFTVNNATTVSDFAGEYLLGSDCTMTGKSVPAAVEFDGVVANGGSDFMLIVREPGITRSGGGSRIESQTVCNTAALNGAYSYQGDGSVTAEGRVFSIAEVGILNFNGSGAFKGVYSASLSGLVERREYSGRYEIGADCTANATFKIGDADYVMNFVVANLGNSLLFSTTGGGITITGGAARQFPR